MPQLIDKIIELEEEVERLEKARPSKRKVTQIPKRRFGFKAGAIGLVGVGLISYFVYLATKDKAREVVVKPVRVGNVTPVYKGAVEKIVKVVAPAEEGPLAKATQQQYSKLIQEGRIDDVIILVETTKIKPDKDLIYDAFQRLIQNERYVTLQKLVKSTGIKLKKEHEELFYEKIQQDYGRKIRDLDFDGITQLQKETGITLDKKFVDDNLQERYKRLSEAGKDSDKSLEHIKKLKKVTGIKPSEGVTRQMYKKTIEYRYPFYYLNRSEFDSQLSGLERCIKKIEEITETKLKTETLIECIHSDENIEHIIFPLYENFDIETDPKVMKSTYNKWMEEDKFRYVETFIATTKIMPEESVVQDRYVKLIKGLEIGKIEALKEATGIPPNKRYSSVSNTAQEKYRELIGESKVDDIKKLKEATGIDPR